MFRLNFSQIEMRVSKALPSGESSEVETDLEIDTDNDLEIIEIFQERLNGLVSETLKLLIVVLIHLLF